MAQNMKITDHIKNYESTIQKMKQARDQANASSSPAPAYVFPPDDDNKIREEKVRLVLLQLRSALKIKEENTKFFAPIALIWAVILSFFAILYKVLIDTNTPLSLFGLIVSLLILASVVIWRSNKSIKKLTEILEEKEALEFLLEKYKDE